MTADTGSSGATFAHADDVYYSMQMIRWFLKPIGAWPEVRVPSIGERIVTDVLIFVCSLLIAITLIPTLMFVITVNDFKLKLKGIGPLSFWATASMKYLSLKMHGGDMRDCFDHVEADWREITEERDREIMMINVKFSRYIASICMVFMHLGIFSFDIVRGLSTFTVTVGNDSFRMHMVPVPFYSGIANIEVSPAYEVVFVLQCLSTFVVNSISVGACGLATTFVMHACGQLGIVMHRLQTLTQLKEESEQPMRKGMADIVERHLRTLSFVSRIEDIMHQICFFELIGCTLNMCLLGYYFITEWEQNETKTSVAVMLILISVTFNIFIFCYIGEILSEQCRQVGEIAYMTEWYLLPKETARCFILIILRSSMVIRLTAGKLIQLSLSTFSTVFRTAIAYLNMLRALT